LYGGSQSLRFSFLVFSKTSAKSNAMRHPRPRPAPRPFRDRARIITPRVFLLDFHQYEITLSGYSESFFGRSFRGAVSPPYTRRGLPRIECRRWSKR
jgi:hypothetical protein